MPAKRKPKLLTIAERSTGRVIEDRLSRRRNVISIERPGYAPIFTGE